MRSPRIALMVDFYPRSPCGERRVKSFMRNGFFLISIHALLAESDRPGLVRHGVGIAISIHALLAESDYSWGGFSECIYAFLSTLSLRRATGLDVTIIGRTWDISIHALLAESDPLSGDSYSAECKFLSTLSLRRATFSGDHGHIKGDISIHALLAESDTAVSTIFRAS